jgi:hypothetical protein
LTSKQIAPYSFIENDEKELLALYNLFKEKAVNAKNEILTTKFDKLESDPDLDDKVYFVTQFMKCVPDFALFPDEEVIKKLKEYGFSKTVIKWFISIDDILLELKELRNIEGAFFILTSLLFALATYIQNKVLIEIIESFDLMVKHGKNEESNLLHKKFDNYFRRRNYNTKREQVGKMNYEEKVLNNFIQRIEKKISPTINFEDLLINATQGKFDALKKLISEGYYAPHVSKNNIYLVLFPVLKLVCIDKVMLSECEFDDLEEPLYGGSYRKYRISRVKKVLSIG